MRLLREVADAGTALVVVSHDQGILALLADRILPMINGQLAQQAGLAE
jgi:ABC-type glutathione transport system ATPase component